MGWNKLILFVLILIDPFFLAVCGFFAIFMLKDGIYWFYVDFINYNLPVPYYGFTGVIFCGCFFALLCKSLFKNLIATLTVVLVSLGLLTIAFEVICIISAWLLKDATEILFGANVYHHFRDTYSNSDIDPQQLGFWAAIQRQEHCCGLHNYTDYYNIPIDDNAENFTMATIPLACCQQNLDHPCAANDTSDLYQTGCSQIIYANLTNCMADSCYVFAVVCCLQVIGLIATVFHSYHMHRTHQRFGYEAI